MPNDLGGPGLNGPEVRINVPENAFVSIYAQVDISVSDIQNDLGIVYLVEPTDFPALDNPPQILQGAPTLPTFVTKATCPGTTGTGIPGGILTYPATPGVRTYSLQYSCVASGTDYAAFKNRKLWVWTNG